MMVQESQPEPHERAPSGERAPWDNLSDAAVQECKAPTTRISSETDEGAYTKTEKWILVAMVAVAGLASPMPANIYFPAIPMLADAFGKSINAMNQTVTVYLVMQALSPMLWGPLSDRYGRRIVFLLCLSVLVASSIGLALCPTDAFWLLLFLRCFQSGGGASTIAVGAGVIGDISLPSERGGFFGIFNVGPQLAPCIGPVAGGVLAEKLGWRSIFWFLTIMAAFCQISVLLFLPETLQGCSIGRSRIMHMIRRPVVPVVGKRSEFGDSSQSVKATADRKIQSINPLIIFTYPDVLILLSFTGIVYAVNYTITASISSSFASTYPYLSETALGLCYLSTGGGMLVGSTCTGKLLDREFARAKFRTNVDSGVFKIEHARLRLMPLHLIIFALCVVAWGWALDRGASIAVPLVLQFILGYVSISILNATMTLNIDILQHQSSGATACTNLVRCSLAAVLVSVIDRMTSRLGFGWSYVLLGGISILQLPLMYVAMAKGPSWREKRESAR